MTNIRHIRRAALALAGVALLLAGSAAVRAQAKVDLTGIWIFTVETDGGGGTPTVDLKQEGEKITGKIASATFGEQVLTGTLKGTALEFTFPGGDVAPSVVYKGTVEGNDAIKGTLDIGPGAIAGTFTAKRKS